MTTKSDRQRIIQAIGRYELRYLETRDATNAGIFDSLNAAVDWLRAEYKLVERFLDDGSAENGWLDGAYDHIHKATIYIAGTAAKLAMEITDEVKK